MDQVADGRGITPMLEQMNEYIVQQGLADMRANASTITQDCEKYVEALLDLYNKFSKLVEEATDNDPRFLSARDKGFEEIVNNCSIFMLEIPNKPKRYYMSIVVVSPRNQSRSKFRSSHQSKLCLQYENYPRVPMSRTSSQLQ